MARFVLPHPEPFESWWQRALERLSLRHPKSEEGPNDVGRPIPRCALDPSVSYEADEHRSLLAAFVAGLDPSENPLLATRDEMKSAGFSGEPYQR
jgi:hypothetical protein